MSNSCAFLAGIVIAILFDIYQAILSSGNWILLSASVVCIVVTIYGLAVNLPESEELSLKWMTAYTIPAALVVVGMLVDKQSFENGILTELGHKPNPNILPGDSDDYIQSVKIMFFSFTIPLQALAINAVFCGLRLVYDGLVNPRS